MSACERNTHTGAPSTVTSQGRGPLVKGILLASSHDERVCNMWGMVVRWSTDVGRVVTSLVLKSNAALFLSHSTRNILLPFGKYTRRRFAVKGEKWATRAIVMLERCSRTPHNLWQPLSRGRSYFSLSP